MKRSASCLFVFLIACGGGGDSAEDKCLDLLDTVCDRAVECGLSSSHDSCIEQAQREADCSEAEKVGESYSACVGAIEDASCATLFPTTNGMRHLSLPATCAGALE
jgi:hypothetical protein